MKSSKEVTPNDETLRYYFYFVQDTHGNTKSTRLITYSIDRQ